MRTVITMILLCMTAACASDGLTHNAQEQKHPRWEEIHRTVDHILTYECQKSEQVLQKEGLDDGNILRIHEFCAMSREEMLAEMSQRFSAAKDRVSALGEETQSIYACYYNGSNTDIPHYSDLGLSSSTCTWHDPNPGCRIEGLVACLWGCNNNDPVLGWHTKTYASKSAVEADLFPKGYVSVNDYAGGSYRRSVGRGYSYQVHPESIDANGQGIWHCEGPEPDPQFSWYAYLGGWWPSEVETWHKSC